MHAVESASDSAAVSASAQARFCRKAWLAGARIEYVASLHREPRAAQGSVRQKKSLRRIVIAQTAGPAGGFLRRIARQNAAATGNQQERGAIPATQQLRHAVKRKSLADSAQIEIATARSRRLNRKLLRQ